MSLPLVDAILNASSAMLLCAGLAAIKSGRRGLHERLMYTALAASTAFLACYLYYHFAVLPEVGVTKFNGTGAIKTAYYAMLASHVLLAVVIVPLALRTIFLARRARWDAHKRWAKVTFPIWLYVSVTGVIVYLALYVWNPPQA
jgi:uncharacterized membrane protein YozB (DUF420 family)